ncbi:MAG TPA: GNAT family N-acetyltransferase [Marmoricola sp.]|nr:GNAT family N-acetyltransferase [Marmoricola sp.]
MDRAAVLAEYDEQIRRHPEVQAPGVEVEREGGVVRVVAAGEGLQGVMFSDLDESTADAAIAAQVERFATVPGEWEWKHHSHDRPADLPERLLRAEFVAEPAETLMVAEVATLDVDVPPPDGVEIVAVEDAAGIDALVRVHDAVFGGDHSFVGRYLSAHLHDDPPTAVGVLAVADGGPVSSGRVELTHGTDFASLWGGGTVPRWRGRGVFRAMVAYRARLSAEAGFRYLQVDASDESRPILARLGFEALAVTIPFKRSGLTGRRSRGSGPGW